MSTPSFDELITDEYKAQNAALHDSEPTYGTSGWQYANAVTGLCAEYDTRNVLDYGCGKGTLADHIPFPIFQYDPAIPEFSRRPSPADIVVCGDVLEHIEPDCLRNVLLDLHILTRKVAYFVIGTRPAAKTLPDGRNCHLIVQDEPWWRVEVQNAGFDIYRTSRGRKGEAIFTARPD